MTPPRKSARLAARAGQTAAAATPAPAAEVAPPPPQVKKRKAEEASPSSPPPKRTSPRRAAATATVAVPATAATPAPPPVAKSPPRKKKRASTMAQEYSPPLGLEGSTMLRDDLFAIFGDNNAVEAVLAVKEPEVDKLGLPVRNVKTEKAQRLESFLKKQNRRKKGRKDGERGARGRQQVRIKGDNWVLFDPTRGYPPTIESAPPSIFKSFERYRPGKTRILAYNLDSFAVALKTTPKHFEGHEIQYAKTGPKLVKSTMANEKANTTTA